MKSKIVLLVMIIAFTVKNSNAQFSVGAETALATGSFSNFAGVGFGGSLRYDAPIKNKVNWAVSTGYLSFSGKTINYYNLEIPFGNSTIIPIAVGLKVYFTESSKGFYGAGDLSANFISSYSYIAYYSGGSGSGYKVSADARTQFGIAPGIGFRNGHWDFSGKFNLVNGGAGGFGYANLRIAYGLGTTAR